jgi:hypothetical protein
MAIRELRWGREAVENTAAATFVNMPVESFTVKNIQPRKAPKEFTGTNITVHKTRKMGKHSEFTLKMYAYFDMLGYPLMSFLGVPVVAAVAGATGAFTATWKAGGATIPSATIQWKHVSSTNTTWRQITGAKVKSMKSTIVGNDLALFEFEGVGRYATTIAAPAALPYSFASYVQPTEPAMQALTKNATAWEIVKKLDLTMSNGLEPDWTIRANADPQRMKLGDSTGDLSVESFFDGYTGSVVEQHEGDGLIDQVIATITDTVSSIGTGTPTTPQIMFTFPKPYTQEGDIDAQDTDDHESGKLALGYDNSAATNVIVVLRNELAATAYDGS